MILCTRYKYIMPYLHSGNQVCQHSIRHNPVSDPELQLSLLQISISVRVAIERGQHRGGRQTLMLASDATSHSNSWQAPRPTDPARDHSCDARAGSLTVAMTQSPRARSCLTNSSPMPLLAPTMTHVGILSKHVQRSASLVLKADTDRR